MPAEPITETNDVHADTIYENGDTSENQVTQPYIVRILDHRNHPQGTITYKIQRSDTTITDNVKQDEIPRTLLVEYLQDLANPRKNPHLRRRGRPRKGKGGGEGQTPTQREDTQMLQ